MYFNLKEPNSDKDTLIILRYYISKKEGRFVYSTGLHIHPDNWDLENKLAKAKRGDTALRNINRQLEKYIDFLDKTINYCKLNDIDVTKEILKKAFKNEFSNDVDDNFVYLSDFTQDFINKAPKLINRTTRTNYSKTSVKHYQKNLNRFKEFEVWYGKKIRMDAFTLQVYESLVSYLKDERFFAINTIGNIIKDIKLFLKRADQLGYKIHDDFHKHSFTVLTEESVSVALNEDEIEAIFKHDFSNKPYLENTRDLAIIGLWTGLRVSDFMNLDEIRPNDKFITVNTKKTKAKVIIPLHKHIKEVVSKRGMPHKISDVKFNEYIKEVCKEVGIDEEVRGSLRIKDQKNNVYRKVTDYYPKYKLISSHTCRRSFATNLYKMGFPSISIMQITGHRTEKNFLNYIKVTPKEHAEKLLKHWEEYYSNQ